MVRRKTFPLIAVITILALSSLSACSTLRGGEPEPTIGVPQAVKQVDSLLDKIFKAVQPNLKWREGPAHMSEVKNSFTNKPTGEVHVGRHRYVRTKISEKKMTELLTAVSEHWKKERFEISSSNSRAPSLSGKASDGRVVGFTVGGAGDVDISAGIGALSDGPSGDIEGEKAISFPRLPARVRITPRMCVTPTGPRNAPAEIPRAR
ncbi:hypothetical protein ACO0M4_32560 [Streptomyces sp. RGM 3693]|uniref:hypothetical protein n=1 Tax=Streptomyces sp. RGM 3693 TaxID=3413284 RepID=UPI003D2663C0